MHIVADENIPGLEETFARLGTVELGHGRKISKAQLQRADVLLIRSVTRIDRQLLEGSRVRFLGSATIGIDHVDTQAVQECGIHFCHAPGCNADGAAQYTLAMAMLAARRAGFELDQMRAGIVGLGNVGSRLKQLLSCSGISDIVCCDPPLAAAGQPGLAGMDEISQCNLVSFHVPLTEFGPYPTLRLANASFFSTLKPGSLVVNSSRGTVVDPSALTAWLESANGYAALDVWPHEPVVDAALLAKIIVGTPHVAGYSLEGKLNGTRMLFRQFLEWLGEKPQQPAQPASPPPKTLEIRHDDTLEAIILAACPVERDDLAMRSSIAGTQQLAPAQFDQLRSNYPTRRDFCGIELTGSVPPHLAGPLESMGFRLSKE